MAAGEYADCFADFAHPRSALEDLVERAGHIAIFFPKFHCECNHIEYLWASTKNALRPLMDGKMETVRVFLNTYLQNVRVKDIAKLYRRSRRYMVAYGAGKTAAQADEEVAAACKDRRRRRAELISPARSHCGPRTPPNSHVGSTAEDSAARRSIVASPEAVQSENSSTGRTSKRVRKDRLVYDPS